uniref:Uncharacterized protein n=1 Tax=Angiostrongylus cantonensis TaxID=6313 RepID=A0A0K0CZC2_ANGCA
MTRIEEADPSARYSTAVTEFPSTYALDAMTTVVWKNGVTLVWNSFVDDNPSSPTLMKLLPRPPTLEKHLLVF